MNIKKENLIKLKKEDNKNFNGKEKKYPQN